jgi:hypothetical protein
MIRRETEKGSTACCSADYPTNSHATPHEIKTLPSSAERKLSNEANESAHRAVR